MKLILQKSIAQVLLALTILVALPLASDASNLGVTTVAATSDGSFAGHAKQLVLVFSSDFQGTINGVSYTWAAGGSLNFGPFDYDTVASFDYTVSAGTLYIITP